MGAKEPFILVSLIEKALIINKLGHIEIPKSPKSLSTLKSKNADNVLESQNKYLCHFKH